MFKDFEFHITDDVVLRLKRMPNTNEFFVHDVVMDKETFIECYERWIKPHEINALRGEKDE